MTLITDPVATNRKSSTFQRVTRNMKKIAKQAKNHVGSKIWSKASKHKLGADTNKCNIFVAEMIEKAGASLPHRYTTEISQRIEIINSVSHSFKAPNAS